MDVPHVLYLHPAPKCFYYFLCLDALQDVYVPLTFLVLTESTGSPGTEAASLQILFSLAHITEIPKEADSWDV